jgi:signal transduction histidine kinase
MIFSIRLRIPFFITGSVLMCWIGVFLVWSYLLGENAIANETERVRGQSAELQSLLERAIWNGDWSMVELLIAERSTYPDLEFIVLTDSSHKVLAASRLEWRGSDLKDLGLEPQTNAKNQIQQNDKKLRISIPIRIPIAGIKNLASYQDGYLIIQSRLDSILNKSKHASMNLFWLFFAFLLLISLGVSILLDRLLVKRIHSLTQAIDLYRARPCKETLPPFTPQGDELARLQRTLCRLTRASLHYHNEQDQRQREMTHLLRVVSHDFRAPLLNLHGFANEVAELMKTPDSEDRDQDLAYTLRAIHSNVNRLDALLGGLIEYMKLGKTVMDIKPLQLQNCIEQVRLVFKHQLQELNAELVIQTIPMCLADLQSISQVFSNLIDNSIKYRRIDVPLRIRIYGWREGESVYIEFEDNGIGISEEKREEAFEMFRRLHENNVQGEGLGLALVRNVMYRMNGTIQIVEGAPDAGTVFRLSLPSADVG